MMNLKSFMTLIQLKQRSVCFGALWCCLISFITWLSLMCCSDWSGRGCDLLCESKRKRCPSLARASLRPLPRPLLLPLHRIRSYRRLFGPLTYSHQDLEDHLMEARTSSSNEGLLIRLFYYYRFWSLNSSGSCFLFALFSIVAFLSPRCRFTHTDTHTPDSK